MNKDNQKISDELLIKYFRCETDIDETRLIESWYENGGEKERKRFRDIHDFYEGYIMNAPIELLDGKINDKTQKQRGGKIVHTVCAALLNIAATIAIFYAASYYAGEKTKAEMYGSFTSISAAAGQRLDISLSDGTIVKLNSGATLKYPNVFSDKSREISLDGEAFFDVARDTERPFVVKTFASDIEVLGTEFNVRAYEKTGKFSTTLINGSVKIKSRMQPGKEIIMVPNQTVKLKGKDFSIENVNGKNALRWTEGILDIDTHDFAELMEMLEMAFGVEISIDRDTYPELTYVNGKLRINDGIVSALNALQEVADFQYTMDYNTNIIHIK